MTILPYWLSLATTLASHGVNAGLFGLGPSCVDAPAAVSTFEFASTPWLNLFNFLSKQGKLARGVEDDGLGARGYVAEDTAAIRPLDASEAAVWRAAVDYFARVVVPEKMGVDSLVLNVTNVLGQVSSRDDVEHTRLPRDLRQVLEAAMPVYRAAWWPSHDRRNQAWISSMRRLLDGAEQCLAHRAEDVFRAPWPTAPLHVNATVYATWFGAYSTQHPTQITVAANAAGSQGKYGLEVLLHETGHGMLDPLDSALAREAGRRNKRVPAELSHLVLFYTSGALMRERDPRYVPFADEFGIWRTPPGKHYHTLIAEEWQPYLSGSRTFDEAVAGLVSRID